MQLIQCRFSKLQLIYHFFRKFPDSLAALKAVSYFYSKLHFRRVLTQFCIFYIIQVLVYERWEIKFGQDSNEIGNTGDSQTQFPQEYLIETETEDYCLIDTPGIGDSRGIHKDKENFANILAFLANYEKISAVVVLVKPNISRLTVAFKFCVLELLTHLHRSLTDNIIFAFTNSRGTFYRPGDSFPVLKKLLREYNINIDLKPPRYFCFDNECFR